MDTKGQPGGACTSALLTVLSENENENLSFQAVLGKLRDKLEEKGFKQTPQLSSSRKIDVRNTFDLIPDNAKGKKRAVMIGINYVGKQKRLDVW